MSGSFLIAWQSEQLHGYSCRMRLQAAACDSSFCEIQIGYGTKHLQQKGGSTLKQITGVVGDLWGSFQDLEGFG